MKSPKYPSNHPYLSFPSARCVTHRAHSHGVHGLPNPPKPPTQTKAFLPLPLPNTLTHRLRYSFTEHREDPRGEQRRNRLPNHEDREEARDSDRCGLQRRRPRRASREIGRRGHPHRPATGSVELPKSVVDRRGCDSHWCAGEREISFLFG
jgi:hypothetical protein